MATLVGIDLGAHTVKVAVMEGRLGKVQLKDYRVRALPHGDDDPRQAAITALKKCRFKPGTRNGKPVAVRLRSFKIRFFLDDGA